MKSTYPKNISSIKMEIPTNSFNHNETEPESTFGNTITIYTLFYLQIQLRFNKLFLYIIVDFKIPNDFTINIFIIIYIRKSLRGLDEYDQIEKEIPLFQTHNNNNNIFEFSTNLDNIIDTTTIADVEMKNLNVDLQGENKAYYDIILEGDSLKNTQKVDEIIRSGGVNFSQVVNNEINYTISEYKVESASKGCNFDLKTNKIIASDHNITLIFEQYYKANKINAKCKLLKNKNIITCSLDKETSDVYLLKDFIYYNENEIFTIVSKNKYNYTYSIDCKGNRYYDAHKNKSLSASYIILTIISSIVVIALIVMALILYKKNRNKMNHSKGISNLYLNNSNIIASSASLN